MQRTLIVLLIFSAAVYYLDVVNCDEDKGAATTTPKTAESKNHAKPESPSHGKGKPRRDWRKVYGLKKAEKE
ncbi:unnamed protein product [Schistosoma turkestanicum]|nr:unnamed protein product [Schistosoma turkestanicum]